MYHRYIAFTAAFCACIAAETGLLLLLQHCIPAVSLLASLRVPLQHAASFYLSRLCSYTAVDSYTLLAWTTSLEDENIALAPGMPATIATRAKAAAAAAFERAHRLGSEFIMILL